MTGMRIIRKEENGLPAGLKKVGRITVQIKEPVINGKKLTEEKPRVIFARHSKLQGDFNFATFFLLSLLLKEPLTDGKTD